MKIIRVIIGALLLAIIGITIYSWRTLRATIPEGVTIYVVPVYGQSLALGEETIMTTNLDSLKAVHGNRIVGSELNGELGYYCCPLKMTTTHTMCWYSIHSLVFQKRGLVFYHRMNMIVKP